MAAQATIAAGCGWQAALEVAANVVRTRAMQMSSVEQGSHALGVLQTDKLCWFRALLNASDESPKEVVRASWMQVKD